MSTVNHEFLMRVNRIPFHGLGLSVDVYSPDLFELVDELDRRGVPCDYLEIFRAAPAALESLRRRLPEVRLAYHAEGLWVTQPQPERFSPFEAELAATAEQLRILGSHWATHECAAKQLGGYAFGTYLPALFTESSAAVTAANVTRAQRRLDRSTPAPEGVGPLLLLETPPLTYIGFGDVAMPDFFRLVTDRAPCGVVLDVGHLWTVYRYTGEWRRRSLATFLADFLDAFPVERIVEVHVAGLAPHPGVPAELGPGADPPLWIDAHGARIPEVLLDMLAQVLDHPRLLHLRGVALEVDTKPIPMIIEELTQARERFGMRCSMFAGRTLKEAVQPPPSSLGPRATEHLPRADWPSLGEQYDHYARIVTGRIAGGLPMLGGEASGLPLYVEHYLPHEILEWGGAVRDMFPETCRSLDRAGLTLDGFLRFWFREPRATEQAYDFFLLKIARFVDFVREVLPAASGMAEREAQALRAGYRAACETVGASCPMRRGEGE